MEILNKNYDIIGICETKIEEKFKINFSGYKVYRFDKSSRSGGVALFVNDKIKHNLISLPKLLNVESIAIEVEFNHYKIVIIQVYVPQNKMSKIELNKLFNISRKVIIMGDLNARRIEWNCFANNRNGNILLDYCLTNHINISAPERPTHFPKIGRPSIIDFFLIKNYSNYPKPISMPILNSDHNPVFLILNERLINKRYDETLDFKNANWANFRKYLDDNINLKFHIKSRTDVK